MGLAKNAIGLQRAAYIYIILMSCQCYVTFDLALAFVFVLTSEHQSLGLGLGLACQGLGLELLSLGLEHPVSVNTTSAEILHRPAHRRSFFVNCRRRRHRSCSAAGSC